MTDAVLLYLDTNVFIELVQGEPAISAPIQSLFKALRDRPRTAIMSELTLAEVLAPSKGRKRRPDLKRRYLDLIVWGRFVDLHAISRSILYETANLRATRSTAKLKLPDAIHLATAIRAGCGFFVSGDRSIPTPGAMRGVRPDAGSIEEILSALR